MKLSLEKKRKRLQTLAWAVAQKGPVHLKDAARLLDVSEMTVRRDLVDTDADLAYLGGYIVAADAVTANVNYNFRKEADRQAVQKEQACLEAIKLIEEDDVLFIDCGTTTPYLARLIPNDKRLTVVCYSLNIADILSRKNNVRLVLLGGYYHAASATFSSDEALKSLGKIHIGKAFITAGGIHMEKGISCSHFHEVTIKQAAITNALKKYVIVDSSKFGKVKLAHFADLKSFEAVITDPGISAGNAQEIKRLGSKVLCGPPIR
ncbi:DeoR/GlpR family DNA-binding transcription regulator [Microvirga sp. W0021]|uniref:DeoR/GlpR family DNA-binding transcription regulator n=1 Tax=Hohaiivirga grylli TaxID=3133970 RepID=A0ABV0BGQ5_9HYPH